jgi:FKBP-type peptidyl-prolyl cis-trans isomerase
MKFKSILTLAVISLTVSLLMVSCNFGQYPGYKKTESGIYYKIHNSDNEDTTRVLKDDIISMNLSYGLKDSILFDSKMMPEEIKMSAMEPQYPGDFFEALRLFRQGDSVTFILKAGPFFTKTVGQPQVPAFATEETDLYFNVKISKVQSKEQVDAERKAQNAVKEQEELARLQQYVTQNNIKVTPSSTGIYYMETRKGTGKSPEKDQYVSAHFTVYLLGNSEKLFSTLDRGEPVDFKFGSPFENAGFQEVIGMMKEGGKANAIVPSAMAFGERGAGDIVPPFSSLYYEVELVDILSQQEFDKKQADIAAKKQAETARLAKEEDALIQKYIKDNNIVPTTVLPNGLIYVETLKGTGDSPLDGKKVKVHYTGKLLDGTMFDTSLDDNQPLEFAVGRRAVIEGWDAGIPLMKAGGKATLIIPSKLGYKERGSGNVIPPNATLVFDVELVEVEK